MAGRFTTSACAAGVTLALALGLAGCKKQDAADSATGASTDAAAAVANDKNAIVATDASLDDVSKQVAANPVKPRAGRWEGSIAITDLQIPNLTPEAKATLKQRISQARTFATCLTPEQAVKPEASFFQQSAKGCKYDHFTMAGGTVDAKITCSQNGQQRTMRMNGTYGSESYAIKVNVSGAPGTAPAGTPQSMSLAIQSKRVGECNGTEAKTPEAK